MNRLQSVKKVLLLTLCGSGLAVAGTICPGAPSGTNFPHPPDPNATGCNLVVTIAANGTASAVVTDAIPYENSDDWLVGVKNNSSTPLGSLTITGALSFVGDGICTFTFAGSGYCTPSQQAGTDPFDYQGPTSTFTYLPDGTPVAVNFNPAVSANGGTSYFSLNGQARNFTFTAGSGGPGGPGGPPATPVPPSLILALTGLAGAGLYSVKRKFRRPRV